MEGSRKSPSAAEFVASESFGKMMCLKYYQASTCKSEEAAAAMYTNYQLFLGNMMVVSTLVLGFVMTGTLLYPSFTGEEAYGSGKLQDFLLWTGMSGMAALFSLIITFLTHARGVDVFTRKGPQRAFRAMKRSMFPIVVAESGLYFSLFFFMHSVEHFIQMVYVGPDICPYGVESDNALRMKSFCAVLSSDLYSFANASCRANSPTFASFLCSEFASWKDQGRKSLAYYIWEMAGEDQTDAFQRLSVEAAEGFCRKSLAQAMADAACKTPWDTPFKQQACASSLTANKQADQCVDAKVADAVKCRRVCALVNSVEPGPQTVRTVSITKWFAFTSIASFAAFRLWKSCMVTLAYQYSDIQAYGCFNSLFNIVSDEWLDDEDTSMTPSPSIASSASQAVQKASTASRKGSTELSV